MAAWVIGTELTGSIMPQFTHKLNTASRANISSRWRTAKRKNSMIFERNATFSKTERVCMQRKLIKLPFSHLAFGSHKFKCRMAMLF
jgi:hypothetical protein